MSRITLDMLVDDISKPKQVLDYICVFGMALIIVYGTYTRISHLIALIIVFT